MQDSTKRKCLIWLVALLVSSLASCSDTHRSHKPIPKHSSVPKVWKEVRGFVRAELGLDPQSYAWPDDTTHKIQDLFNLLVTDASEMGHALQRIRIRQLVSDAPKFFSARGVLVRPRGRSVILLGAVSISKRIHYQIMEANGLVLLVRSDKLESDGFREAWIIQKNHNAPVTINVASGTLLVDKMFHNFGLVPRSHLKTEFNITNNGKTPLVFQKAKTSCTCTVVNLSNDRILQPGQSFTMVVDVASVDEPSFKQSIKVPVTEVGKNFSRILDFTLAGNYEDFFDILPKHLDFGNMSHAGKSRRTIRLSETGALQFQVDSINTNTIPLTWTMATRKDDDNAHYLITFELDPRKIQPGHHRGSLTIRTTNPSLRNIDIPVEFQVPPHVYMEPRALAFGEITLGEAIKHHVKLRSTDGESFTIFNAQSPDGIDVAVEQTDNQAVLTVTAQPEKKGPWNGKAVIEVRSKHWNELLVLKCAGYVR